MQFDEYKSETMNISALKGLTVDNITNEDNQQLIFNVGDDTYVMYHGQDCCERVEIEDICGDLDDIVGSPVLFAAEVSSDSHYEDVRYESSTWTFYNLATIKGSITIRWLGVSNGCYSEKVDFAKVV